MTYKYTATFTATAKVISPTDQDRFVAKASLASLKGLLPPDVDPENDPDLLYISCNGAVAGLINRNDDGVTNETALLVHDSAKHKYITTDHDRTKAAGVVLYPGFSRFGTSEPLTREEAAALKEPFNTCFAGVIWKTINPMLANYIVMTGDDGMGSLSMSWEIGFENYSIAVGSQNLFDAEMIHPDDSRFSVYDKYLRINKGDGKDPAGKPVYRVIGDKSTILGYSIVGNPAAHVKGILPIEKTRPDDTTPASLADITEIPVAHRIYLEKQTATGQGYHLCDITMTDGEIHKSVPVVACRYIPKHVDGGKIASITICEKTQEKNITLSEASVKPNTALTMKITNLTELEAALTSAKLEATASVVDFVKAIKEGSDKFEASLAAKENLAKTVAEAKEAAEAKVKELEKALAEVREELGDIKETAEQAAAAQKFQERMAAFDETFDLDVDDTKIIAEDIQGLDDESFAKYMSKCKKLMAGKAKKAKEDDSAFNSKKKDDEEDEDEEDDKKESKAAKKKLSKKKNDEDDEEDPGDDDEDGDEDGGEKDGKKKTDKKSKASTDFIKEALASIIKDKESELRSASEPDLSLKDELKAAFAGSIRLDGKTESERKSKK